MKRFILSLFFIPSFCLAELKIAVLDTGLANNLFSDKFCEDSFQDFTGEGRLDIMGHGTNVTGLIIKTAPKNAKYCIKMYKGFSRKNTDKAYLEALKQIAKDRVDILNISAGGLAVIPEEIDVIKSILDKGTIVVVAAGNERMDLSKDCSYFPACIDKRLVVVGNGTAKALFPSSNFGGPVDLVVDGIEKSGFGVTLTGTSQATAITTGLIIGMIHKNDKTYKKWTDK